MTIAFFLKILLIASMLATAGVLALGLLNMFRADKTADERSNKMMRLRILFQALAIFLFSVLPFFRMK
jgi:hypothetical protein